MRMGEILIICFLYPICESAVLVWSTLLDEARVLGSQVLRCGVDYVAIPDPYSSNRRSNIEIL